MSTSPSESETTPEEYRQRALLFADLGRYDDAATEVAAGLETAPDDASLLATLARVHIAAEQPAEALLAAERAVTAAAGEVGSLVVRAMALTDNRRFADAALVAGEILAARPDDAYAQRTGAALLSESRNGQDALNAAWRGVRLADTDAESHLVLAMVAARLRLFDLAQQAYARALDLDEAIGDAQQDVGIVRLERRRWARALEDLADEAALGAAAANTRASANTEPEPEKIERTVVSRPAGPVLDTSDDSADGIRQAVLYGANGVLVAALLTALMSTASGGASRVWAGLISVIIFVAVLFWLGRRLVEPTAAALARLRRTDQRLVIAAYLTFGAPLLILVYALVGGLIPLIAAMVVAATAEVMVLLKR